MPNGQRLDFQQGQARLLALQRTQEKLQPREEKIQTFNKQGLESTSPSRLLRTERLRKRAESKRQLTSVATEAVGFSSQFLSARALQQSWIWLIPSSFLTLLYINFHAFGRAIFPHFFCKLGSEWMLLKTKTTTAIATPLGWFEIAALILLDILVIALIIFIVGILVALIDLLDSFFGFFLGLFS